MTVGCNRSHEHADVKDIVDTAMTQHGLGVVKVSQDRDKGVLTLTGDVESAQKKDEAEDVAKQAAPDYAISNEIGFVPSAKAARPRLSIPISIALSRTITRRP